MLGLVQDLKDTFCFDCHIILREQLNGLEVNVPEDVKDVRTMYFN